MKFKDITHKKTKKVSKPAPSKRAKKLPNLTLDNYVDKDLKYLILSPFKGVDKDLDVVLNNLESNPLITKLKSKGNRGFIAEDAETSIDVTINGKSISVLSQIK